MTTNIIIGLSFLGLLTGILSGMLGIGGGLILIPALVLIFGFPQRQAVATSLAMMLPPIGLFAVIAYYQAGNVNVKAAAVLAGTFVVGTLISAWIVNRGLVSDDALRKVFAFFMLYAAGNMLFRSDRMLWATLKTLLIVGAFAVLYRVLRIVGRKWERQSSSAMIYHAQAQQPSWFDYQI